MRRRKRTRLEIDSDDLNHDSSTNTSHSSISVPSGKRQRIRTSCNTNSRRKNKPTNSNSVNSNSNYNHNEQKETTKQKIKNQKPSFESFKINKFEAKNYCNQKINVLFGSKLISVQWLLLNEKNSTDNKLYNNAKTVRINIKFDNIQCVKYESKSQWGKILRLKLKKPPYFTEQACRKLRESHQKSAHFYTINTYPTNGFAPKYKNYKISLKTTSEFINKLKNGSGILKQLIEENENKQIDWDHNEIFNQNELKQISKNKNKNKDLCKVEVDKILISLGVKKEDVQSVNGCLRAAISKKYVGITRGRFRLDINKGINQKMNKLSALLNGGCDYDENDECKCYKEITLKSLIEQPNCGGMDYENGNMEAAAKCKCMQVDEMYCCDEPLMYVTDLCTNKPKLIDGKFHNHCEKAACNKCMGDYRNMHCSKCGVHDAWCGECDHCDDGSDSDSDYD